MPDAIKLGLAFIALTYPISALSQQQSNTVHIAAQGQTKLQLILAGQRIVISFQTHSIHTPTRGSEFPYDQQTSCTLSRNPCVLLDNLRIKQNGKEIFVPRSTYSDLGDVFTANLSSSSHSILTLTLTGGDASEAYQAHIHFTSTRVLDRDVWATGQLIEKTSYSKPETLN